MLLALLLVSNVLGNALLGNALINVIGQQCRLRVLHGYQIDVVHLTFALSYSLPSCHTL